MEDSQPLNKTVLPPLLFSLGNPVRLNCLGSAVHWLCDSVWISSFNILEISLRFRYSKFQRFQCKFIILDKKKRTRILMLTSDDSVARKREKNGPSLYIDVLIQFSDLYRID